LRTTEFLWQEGHTAHATEEEARRYALRIFGDVYVDTMERVCAVPLVVGHKTARERFAGAIRTWSCEGMMGDGKALQMGTSHELGQNFARAFSIQFTNDTGTLDYVWQTSWGVSTRLIGALVMAHGDDFGLRLPPSLAPAEVVVLAVRDEPEVRTAAEALVSELVAAGRRVRLDERYHLGFGRRSVDWERKGVPVRLEVGPRDLAEGQVTMVIRHLRTKQPVPLAGAGEEVDRALRTVAADLSAEAAGFRDARTVDVTTIEEATEAGRTGFARLPVVALGPEGEDRLAAESLSVRCLQRADGTLAQVDDEDATLTAVIGRSY
jgi:prolyl-tRNA synthetase